MVGLLVLLLGLNLLLSLVSLDAYSFIFVLFLLSFELRFLLLFLDLLMVVRLAGLGSRSFMGVPLLLQRHLPGWLLVLPVFLPSVFRILG